MSALLLVLVGAPAAAGTLLCLAGRRADRAAPVLAVLVTVLMLVLSLVAAALHPSAGLPFLPAAGFGLEIDALAAAVMPVVAAVTLLVLVAAAASHQAPAARFHGLMLLFAAAVLLTLAATTLPALLFAWEIMGAASYALIGFRWGEQHRVSAGLTAFVTTRTADLGLYLAAGAALAGAGSLSLADLPAASGGWRDAAAAGILAAALGKAAQLPFSFWLSRAMEGPSTVSALLHSAAMVAMGGYLLLKVQPLLAATAWAGPAAAWAGAATAVLLGLVAVAQRDLKQLLAASTSAQLGYVVLAAGVGAVSGGAAHLMAHAATKAGLFLAAGAWLGALGTKQLSALRGAARRWPVLGGAFAVAALALAGVPPLSLWATKDEVLAAAAAAPSGPYAAPALYAAGLAGAVLSAAYAAKALALLWQRLPADAEEDYDTEERGTRQVSRWQQVPPVVLAAMAAVAGLLVAGPVGTALRAGLGEGPRPGPAQLLASAGLAVAAAAAVVLVIGRRGRQPGRGPAPRRGGPWERAASGWLGLERAAAAVVVRPTFAAARLLAAFDDGLDRAVDRLAGLVPPAAGAAARLDSAIDSAVGSVAAGMRAAGRQAKRPQTGLVHQYYAQAAVFLAAAVLLLLLVR